MCWNIKLAISKLIVNKYITFSEKMQFLKIIIKNINNKDLGTEYLHLMMIISV